MRLTSTAKLVDAQALRTLNALDPRLRGDDETYPGQQCAKADAA